MFADEKNIYMILEFCNMGTLKSYVESKKRLSEKEGIDYSMIVVYKYSMANMLHLISCCQFEFGFDTMFLE